MYSINMKHEIGYHQIKTYTMELLLLNNENMLLENNKQETYKSKDFNCDFDSND